MKLLLKIISPIIASVLGVLLTNSFNLFDVIPFVPKEESFGLCIMVYFPIIDVIFNFIFEQFYKSLVDKFTSRLTATITSYTYSFGTDFFIWLIYRVYNSNYNIEISPDDKKLKLDAIKGFKGDTDDLQTKVTATGESVMNIISTLSFLLESNNLNQVKVDLNYSKHSNITLTLQKDTVCIDPNSYCGIFETDETSEETISKLYLMVYLEILAQLRQEYYNDIDNEDWNTNVHSDFLQQVGKKLSEKIDEKTQAIKNKKQTITE